MSYIKLIAIKLGDFSSDIKFEQNYSINDSKTYIPKKKILENNGYICILANMESGIRL